MPRLTFFLWYKFYLKEFNLNFFLLFRFKKDGHRSKSCQQQLKINYLVTKKIYFMDSEGILANKAHVLNEYQKIMRKI